MDEEAKRARCNEAVEKVSAGDFAGAAAIFRELAALEYPNAQFGLAEMKYNGTPADVPEAIRLYTAAASGGHAAAMFRLSNIMSEEGQYFNPEKARSLMAGSAEAGFPMAYPAAADMMFYGFGGPQDPEGAFKWYSSAAAEGDPVSMFKAGYMLENGVGTAADRDGAIPFFRDAAEAGVPEAAFKMAEMASEGRIPGGKAEAVRWYEICSSMGYPVADFNIATMYTDGDGIDKNPEKAFYHYGKAASAGDGDAYMILGKMHMEGIGTSKDFEKGMEMIGEAAAAGSEAAIQIIADLRRRQNAQLIRIDGTEPESPSYR